MRMGFTCWKCLSRATCVKMKSVSPVLMEAGYQCRNIDCGHTFVVALEAIRTLNPGALANPPGINVPLSRHVQRRALLDQIQLLPERGGPMDERAMPAQLDLALECHGPP